MCRAQKPVRRKKTTLYWVDAKKNNNQKTLRKEEKQGTQTRFDPKGLCRFRVSAECSVNEHKKSPSAANMAILRKKREYSVRKSKSSTKNHLSLSYHEDDENISRRGTDAKALNAPPDEDSPQPRLTPGKTRAAAPSSGLKKERQQKPTADPRHNRSYK